ncbi:hypothetical protein JOE48_003072 [Methylobacterium sp. PvR107]|nr:hypothetical protein [Methylobacterium sp. PvR107]
MVLADRGYDSGDEVLACEGTGILPAMPRADTSGRAKKGPFVRADCVYDTAADHDVCPAGAVLTKSAARSDRHGDIDHYRNLEACHACAMRARCTTEKVKRFKRWKHEAVLEAIEGLDGQYALPDEGPESRENRDEPRHPRLQCEADDPPVRRNLAHPGHSRLKQPATPPSSSC